MKTSLFDFDLPDSLIAATPTSPRDSARMLAVGDSLQDKIIRDLPQFLKPGDVMVFNDTKVIPARLFGRRGEAKVEILLHKALTSPSPLEGSGAEGKLQTLLPESPLPNPPPGRGLVWRVFARPAKRLKPGNRIDFAGDFHAVVMEKLPDGEVLLQFGENLYAKLERYGHVPLPPYIRRPDDHSDRRHYQTVYARHEGSVAAPTAGLHFTDALLKAIDAAGCVRAHVTLHVGGGTFLPVKSEDTEDHVMHSEWIEISGETAERINRAKEKGGRVIAVGTTSLRTLESAADGGLKAFSGETSIFITPGYRFKIVDMLLTNFHLPRSTLFMLTCAFCGTERMKAAYAHAIAQTYRFYSYGDACLLYCHPERSAIGA